jgi:hypothetical protein
MKKQSRYRKEPLVPQRFDYEVATIGSGIQTHAMVGVRAVCGWSVRDRTLHYTHKAVSCRRCRQRLAAAPPQTYVRSLPPPPVVADENLRVILMLLEELGGSTTLLVEPTPEVLAEQFARLQPLLSTHVIVIGEVPLDGHVNDIGKRHVMAPQRRFRKAALHLAPDPIGYEIATLGGGQKHHAVTASSALCGLNRRALCVVGNTITCQRCLVRIARHPDRYYHLKPKPLDDALTPTGDIGVK